MLHLFLGLFRLLTSLGDGIAEIPSLKLPYLASKPPLRRKRQYQEKVLLTRPGCEEI